MFCQSKKFIWIATVIIVAFITVSCGTVEIPTDESEESAAELSAQAVSTATPTSPSEPTATPVTQPTMAAENSTELKTEIMEPVSPVSPVSPSEDSAMTAAQNMEAIPGSEEALAAALADLSEKSGIAAGEITLVSMEEVEWNDASLGCPQEGFMYAQVITPGYLIVLEAQGEEYEYHTDKSANVVLCEK